MLEHLLIPPWGKKDKGSTTCPADCPVLPRGHLDSHESTQRFLRVITGEEPLERLDFLPVLEKQRPDTLLWWPHILSV